MIGDREAPGPPALTEADWWNFTAWASRPIRPCDLCQAAAAVYVATSLPLGGRWYCRPCLAQRDRMLGLTVSLVGSQEGQTV
jgi:hypothetical protein